MEPLERLFRSHDWPPCAEKRQILDLYYQLKFKWKAVSQFINTSGRRSVDICPVVIVDIDTQVNSLLDKMKNQVSAVMINLDLHDLGKLVEDMMTSLEISCLSQYLRNNMAPDDHFWDLDIEPTSVCVGFDVEASNLIQQLITDHHTQPKKLHVVSILGERGTGKSTLARKVYYDPLVVNHFDIRAWIFVPLLYPTRKLLLDILTSFVQHTDELRGMNADKLTEVLYQNLKGQRYLIVVDDIWNTCTWEDIRRSLPNDNNGSRIMLTTWNEDVPALTAQSNPLTLDSPNDAESLQLFQKMAASNLRGQEFDSIGKRITARCESFPLNIALIAGLLKNSSDILWWEQVAQSVCQSEQDMDIISLSYDQLPPYLKPCFLYLGAFPKNYLIPVRKLIWLWIADGFVRKTETRSLEDVAKGFLLDLTNRNLVVIVKTGFKGEIKTCYSHHLLHDISMRKATEENFSPKMYRYTKHTYSCRYFDPPRIHLSWFMYNYKHEDIPDLIRPYFEPYNSFKINEIACVGFDVEASNLIEQLTADWPKQLHVNSIVGMAGLGKTTLARKVYDDPLIVYHFYIRAWVCVMQVYQKRDLLLGILTSIVELTDEICCMSDHDLAHRLYRNLKNKRYLIVVDDIWNIEAWEDIRKSFPNDNNGSRIMLTTRIRDVALHAQSNKSPLFLRFLNEAESFELFQMKVSSNLRGQEFDDIGKKITRKCQGLPLAIVVIAGLLKHSFDILWWEEVAQSVSSYIVSDPEQYMNTLALSYNHLPPHFKPCFLYLGAFPEYYEIPVRKLVCLWIADGFIHEIGTKNLEDVAEDFLLELIKRSLVVIGKKRFNGAIKTCHIHDLLRDLSLRKAAEENFSPKMYRYTKHTYTCAHCSSAVNSSSGPSNVRDDGLSCSASEIIESISNDISMISKGSECLSALDLSPVQLCIFPSVLLQLVPLRYLDLRLTFGSLPEAISDLIHLETLIISSRSNIIIPKNMWKIVSLRHLYIKSGENHVQQSRPEELPDVLENLQTMSLVSPSRSCEHILARTKNLRKLGLCGPLISMSGDMQFLDLSPLDQLETLKLLNTTPVAGLGRPGSSIIFPEGLKHLTISSTNLDWKEAWIFEMIPQLKVLKLKVHAFVGKVWETTEGVFPQLKVLKLEDLDIVKLEATSSHFPMLQRLAVHSCPNLIEIPACFGNIYTLELIELSGCGDSAVNSVKDIQKEEESNGNYCLKILANPMNNSSEQNEA